MPDEGRKLPRLSQIPSSFATSPSSVRDTRTRSAADRGGPWAAVFP